MTIHVVCECGFSKDVPEEWRGMRVKCKCGRSFVISVEGGIQEPPVAAPPRQPDEGPGVNVEPPRQDGAQPSSQRQKASSRHRSDSVSARYHARHDPADSRRRIVLGGGAIVALVCLGALAFVLRDGLFSSPSDGPSAKTAVADQKKNTDPSLAGKKNPSPEPGKETVIDLESGRLDIPIVEPVELQADDALLLTGLFGDGHQQLNITEEQASKIEELTTRFKENADKLVAGDLALEQWYVDGDAVSNELMELLTDEQKTALNGLIEQAAVERAKLEEYAAKLRPELVTPSIVWRIEADSTTRPAIAECLIDGTTNGDYLHTTYPSGTFAFTSGTPGEVKYHFWDLLDSEPLGTCSIPPPNAGDITRIAQGGQLVVRGGRDTDGGYCVQVWAVESPADPRVRTLPQPKGDGDATMAYQLVDCVANRVVCVSGYTYWVWNLDTDEVQEVAYPEWVPVGRPTSAVSPAGQYLVTTHRHSPLVNSRQYNFVEVAIHDLDTGDMLGNQVVATDYRPMHISAVAFSYNGRDLALLWDIDPPEPERLLVWMSAVNGQLRRVTGDIPIATSGYANKNNMPERDLMWLPDNTGWIVNLQSMVDTESEGAIDIDFPSPMTTGSSGERPTKKIVDAIPAGDHRLLLITTEPSADDPTAQQVTGQIIELPALGPFLY